MDSWREGLDVSEFLEELDCGNVIELHVAEGVAHKGFQLDIHSGRASDATLGIALEIIRRAPNLRLVTLEFLKEAIALLGYDAICGELSRIRRLIQ